MTAIVEEQSGISGWIQRRYGRKKAFLRSLLWSAAGQLGYLKNFRRFPLKKAERLVFVCHGNICRSPYGPLIARELGWDADSCGLYATPGNPANPVALSASTKRHRSLQDHHAQAFDEFSWRPGDLLVCFEVEHAEECLKRLSQKPPIADKIGVTLLGLYLNPSRPHIEDPYGLHENYFLTCYELIERALTRMQTMKKQELQKPA